LISAFCIARSGKTLVLDADFAELRMRTLDRQTIARYLDLAGPGVLSSVGAYQIEGLGVNLFERVEGDFSTILGMPMFKLLAWLRRQHLIGL
jgi:septum formation protein